MGEKKHQYEKGKYYWAKINNEWEIVQYDTEPWECFWCMGTEVDVNIDYFDYIHPIPIENSVENGC